MVENAKLFQMFKATLGNTAGKKMPALAIYTDDREIQTI